MSPIKKLSFVLCFTVCLLNIHLWPANKYEWMLIGNAGMILPVDNNIGFYALLSASPILLMLFFLGGLNGGKFNSLCALSTAFLIVIWATKYQIVIF